MLFLFSQHVVFKLTDIFQLTRKSAFASQTNLFFSEVIKWQIVYIYIRANTLHWREKLSSMKGGGGGRIPYLLRATYARYKRYVVPLQSHERQ